MAVGEAVPVVVINEVMRNKLNTADKQTSAVSRMLNT